MKLNPEELTVSSFETTEGKLAPADTIIIVNPNDPTGSTWCYICPVRTNDAACY
jgi:histidinol-phosphate/aromatic aminotransferase/cobyric acid decarboxylase-like protein